MRHLWDHGYPVPQVHDADGPDIVMDRLDGATMLEAFGRRPWMIRSWARLLASLHHRLEAVPVPDLTLPRRFGGGEVLAHGDLHPDNVMLTSSGPMVIDWTNTGVGPRHAEAASTWIIVATSEIDSRGLLGLLQRSARAEFLSTFLGDVDRRAARGLLGTVGEHRLNDRNLRPDEATAIRHLLDDELVNVRA